MPRGARVTNEDLSNLMKETRATILSLVADVSKINTQVEHLQKTIDDHRATVSARIDTVEGIALDVKTTRDKAIWAVTIILGLVSFVTYIASASWQKIMAIAHATFR